jgi:hypothetical protein
MVKKTASFVLASHRGLNVPRGYASFPCLLRRRWTDFLTILLTAGASRTLTAHHGFAFWFAAALPATLVSGLLVASFRKA